ncbi:MAG: iron-containing alcohol dehydrogenase [Gemmatimonadetes bacterium]|nr:iron-containing alcohol dehydrogenase [Gemmatimonadota bacterium]
MEPFDYHPSPRVIFGAGALARLADLAGGLGGGRILLVTDPGIVKAGIADRALSLLRGAERDVCLFDGVDENPTTAHVDAGVETASAHGGTGLIVGLGGGSAMDCAKGINFILTNGGRMEDYRGMGRARRPLLPSIGVPTTAGTGSEAQSYALISRLDTHEKMACGDLKARFRGVILDPELTASAPGHVAGAAGIDAIAHAVESYVCKRRNAVSRMYSLEAWRLLASGFEEALEPAAGVDARSAMLLGAHFAGAAIENAMLGAAHACANPLTARYGIPHGVAVGVMLPPVIRFNGETDGALYEGFGLAPVALAERIEGFRRTADLPGCLGDIGVERDRLPELAAEAATQWTGTFNPRPAREADFLALYEEAY